jgi:zinc transporter 1/2/3
MVDVHGLWSHVSVLSEIPNKKSRAHENLSTPIGQALGIFTQSFYSQSSTVGILMVGIMNSISSGLLIYASLVELFAEDFLSEHAEHELPGKRLWIAFSWVFFGAFAMAFVGAYA